MSKKSGNKEATSGTVTGQRIPEADKHVKPVPVRNDQLKADIEELKKNPDNEQYVKVLNAVVNAQLLAPIHLDKEPERNQETGEVVIAKDTEIQFEMIKNNQGELYYPVFTDGAEMRKLQMEEDQMVLMVDFWDLANMIQMQEEQMAGFVINPKGGNMIFPSDMIAKMVEEINRKKQEREKTSHGKESC
ncbi:MAG: SseB family protein [Firmicutes bacterium]|nr:SseB family protein [Bacillota bacterium]